MAGNVAEQRWRDGEIKDAHRLAALNRGLQALEPVTAPCINFQIGKPRQKPCQFGLIDFLLLDVIADRPGGKIAKAVIAQSRARCTYNARRLAELPGFLALVERRQQLAFGKIACRTEDDEIEGIDGNGLAGHEYSPP